MNVKNDFALVPRSPTAVEKAEPAAKRILAVIVADVLALAPVEDPEAMFRKGQAFFSGDGVPKNSTEAVKWYRMAAEQGHASAQNYLGWMYARGEGVPKDCVEAVKWYRRAVEQGRGGPRGSGFGVWGTQE